MGKKSKKKTSATAARQNKTKNRGSGNSNSAGAASASTQGGAAPLDLTAEMYSYYLSFHLFKNAVLQPLLLLVISLLKSCITTLRVAAQLLLLVISLLKSCITTLRVAAQQQATSRWENDDGTTTTSGEEIDPKLHHALEQFRQVCKEQNLKLFDIHFDRATMQHLINVLCEDKGGGGLKNSLGQPVVQLDLGRPDCDPFDWLRDKTKPPRWWHFDVEVSSLFQNFFESNKSPKTLETIVLHRSYYSQEEDYERIVSSFHHCKTVKKFSFDHNYTIRCRYSGAVVGDLLRQNTTLTCLEMVFSPVNKGFIGAIREGLLASRGRLQSLRLEHADIGNQELNELRLVYESTCRENNTVLSELNLRNNYIHGAAGGNHMRRLLLTLPCLKKLEMSCHDPQYGDGHIPQNEDGQEFASALFADAGMAAVMGRLHSLNMANCWIGNEGLVQMAASFPDDAAIVDLNLSDNGIQGHAGGQSLGRVLRCCRKLETLNLSGNNQLCANGSQALAPALTHLHYLKNLVMHHCDIRDGAKTILTSIMVGPRLKSLHLAYNDLPYTTLPMLTKFLNATGGSCLEDLQVGYNWCLFGPTTNCDQQAQPPFFAALANHKHISRYGMGTLTEGSLLLKAALVQNTTLVYVEHWIDRLGAEEYMQRNKILSKMKMTMSRPIGTPLAVWPVALECCSQQQRIHLYGRMKNPACHFWLVQKMMEANVFHHTAAVYRFEKVRACTRIQQWWRQQRQHQHHLAKKETDAVYLFEKVRACTRIQQWWQQQRRRQQVYSMLEEDCWLDSRTRTAGAVANNLREDSHSSRLWIDVVVLFIILILLLLLLLIFSSSFTTLAT